MGLSILQKFRIMLPLGVLSLVFFFGACGVFDKDLEQDKHIAAFRHQMLVTLDSLKNPEDRIRNLDSIISRINSDDALITERKKNIVLKECYSFISSEYCDLKNYTKAIEICNISLSIDSSDAGGYFSRGVAYQGRGDVEKALADYDKAISINDNYTDAYYNRGVLYDNLENYEDALKDYTKAIKQNPSYIVDIYLNRGNVYQKMDEKEKALEDYNQTLKLDSLYVAAYSNRGNIYTGIGEYEMAVTDYTKAIQLDSLDADAYNKRGFVYELRRDYEQAERDYKETIKLDPKNAKGLKAKGQDGLDRLKIAKRLLKEIHRKNKSKK
ncbi:MAG: tetratricopeptide repeat protein [Dysgonomonas sp.]